VTDLLAGRAQMACGVSKVGARSRKMRICRWDPIFGTPHALPLFLNRHNYRRPHGSLGKQAPAARPNNLVGNYT
jgi:hypothetical protein